MSNPNVLAVVLLLSALGCRASDASGPTQDKKATPLQAEPAAPAPATQPTPQIAGDETIQSAKPAANVTGAFLTMSCARFDPALVLDPSKAQDDVLGCIFKTGADGARYAGTLDGLSAKLTVADGSELTPTALPTRDDLGWHVALKVPKDAVASLKQIRIGGTAAAASFDVDTADASYDTFGDPAFGPEWRARKSSVLYKLFRSVPDENCALPPDLVNADPRVWPLPAEFLQEPYQLVFVTSAVYTAAALGGIDGADAICAAAGAKIDASSGRVRQWRAMLGTSKEDARTHAPVTAPVFNTLGIFVAKDAETFWNPKEIDGEPPLAPTQFALPADVQLSRHAIAPNDECGVSVIGLNNALDVFGIRASGAWTGTAPGGATDATRTCDDWTSASAKGFGTVGLIYAGGKEFFDNDDGDESCTREHHIYCLSL